MASRTLLTCFVVLLVGACTDEPAGEPMVDGGTTIDAGSQDAESMPDAQTESDMGPPEQFGVGYREDEYSYDSPLFDTPRRLPIQIWYPTTDEDGLEALYRGAFLRDSVFEEASVAIQAPAPLLIFSHGRRAYGQASWFMNEYFASQGWITVSLDHPGDGPLDGSELPQIYAARPMDISAVIDFMQTLPAEHPLSGLVGEQVALTGHSFGGYTTLASVGADYAMESWRTQCAEESPDGFCVQFLQDEMLFEEGFGDPRIGVAIPMAPGNYRQFELGLGAIETPVLLMTGARDEDLADATNGLPIWEALQGEQHLRIQFADGGHFTFTSACTLVASRSNGCGEDNIPLEEAHVVINTYAMAFARYHLFGDTSGQALLNGEQSLHEGVTLTNKEGPTE